MAGAVKVFGLIDRTPPIDHTDDTGLKPDQLQGRFEFKNVRFSYPNRPESKIFRGLSLMIEPGTTVALVGMSGSGKSSTVQLMERFYDPTSGTVRF
jgi:ATP-binding cassette subfamily B (MDR/TAP) protein 1